MYKYTCLLDSCLPDITFPPLHINITHNMAKYTYLFLLNMKYENFKITLNNTLTYIICIHTHICNQLIVFYIFENARTHGTYVASNLAILNEFEFSPRWGSNSQPLDPATPPSYS